MSNIYYASGTLGDTYVIVCKLYGIAISNKIVCKHYTVHKNLYEKIREIYSLLPNIDVEFINNRPRSSKVLCGSFLNLETERRAYGFEVTTNPIFKLEGILNFGLPKKYNVIQLVSGTTRSLALSQKVINKIILESNLPLVVLGTDAVKCEEGNVIDLRGKTSLKDAVHIIRRCNHFYGGQGLLSFVAVSQKIFSNVYVKNKSDIHAVKNRIECTPEWNKFLKRIKI